MTSLEMLARLRAVHRRLHALVAPLDDADYRKQYHHDLSPIGWHLGHCAFIENFWLRERVQGDDRLTRKLHDMYFPELSPKPKRGGRLPPKDTLMDQVAEQHTQNILLLSGTAETLKSNELLEDEYLERFLLQHHSMHFETMHMVLTQRALQRHRADYFPQTRLRGEPVSRERIHNPAGEYHIGGSHPDAFDNELPAFVTELEKFNIARRPVSNAQYLGFIEAGGYTQSKFWDQQGRTWLETAEASAPEHWRRDARGWWYGIGVDGPFDLDPEAPVYGISHYEARAFANYAQARLPHEFEWESACHSGQLQLTGRVWEWCANTFFPYEGYRAFPYDGYSQSWFDDKHYTLRGSSQYTRRDLRRPTIRNFYSADKRHVFAGLRLVF